MDEVQLLTSYYCSTENELTLFKIALIDIKKTVATYYIAYLLHRLAVSSTMITC